MGSILSRCASVAALALVVAACGDAGDRGSTVATPAAVPDDAIVIRASTDLAVGAERLLLALATPRGDRLGSPDLAVEIAAYPEEEPGARQVVPGRWMWAIPEVSGLYRAALTFDRPGVWLAEVTVGGTTLPPVPISVAAEPRTPAVGAPAPRSQTPTSRDVADLTALTTDPSPDPAFYELSVADAVTSGAPAVIVFATPKFCQTAICGPTLDAVKAMAADHPGVNFVHVEVYDLEASPADATSIEQLVVRPAVDEWGLTSEPWVFVVAADGTVAGRFEGVVEPAEIEVLLG